MTTCPKCGAQFDAPRSRTTDQNRLMWMWAHEVADHRGDTTATEIQSEWKLSYGIPLLVRDDDGFAEKWSDIERRLAYADLLEIMPMVSVTSVMTTKQMKEFCDQVYRAETMRGVRLTHPDDRIWATYEGVSP